MASGLQEKPMKMFFLAATLLGLSIGIGAYVLHADGTVKMTVSTSGLVYEYGNGKDFPQDCTVEMIVIVSTSRDDGDTYSTSRLVSRGESWKQVLKDLSDEIGGKP